MSTAIVTFPAQNRLMATATRSRKLIWSVFFNGKVKLLLKCLIFYLKILRHAGISYEKC